MENKIQTMRTVAKGALGVGGLFLLCGIWQGAFGVGLILAVICAAVWLFLLLKADKLAETLQAEYEAQREAKRQKDEAYIDGVMPVVKERYDALCSALKKPVNTVEVEIYVGSSAQHCDCWVQNGNLCLIRTYEIIPNILRGTPGIAISNERMNELLCCITIPVDSIHHYQREGEMYTTTDISGGGGGNIIGVSMGGIGFGEIKREPIKVTTNVHDNRCTVMYVQNGDTGLYDKVYFTHDSYMDLMRVIPDLSR